jgi:2-C-methyl-D-erythritol 4-phosphate cytidylyltransferase
MRERVGSGIEPSNSKEIKSEIENVSIVIVAAGNGLRIGGDVPKAFLDLAGEPMFVWSLKVFDKQPVKEIALVVPENRMDEAGKIVKKGDYAHPINIVNGGEKRIYSVRNGVKSLKEKSKYVLIHDAARPFVEDDATEAVLEPLVKSNLKAALMVGRITSTVRGFEGDRGLETIDRDAILEDATPQIFERKTLEKLLCTDARILAQETDEISLFKDAGYDIGIVWTNPYIFKVTTPEELRIAELVAFDRRGYIFTAPEASRKS